MAVATCHNNLVSPYSAMLDTLGFHSAIFVKYYFASSEILDILSVPEKSKNQPHGQTYEM